MQKEPEPTVNALSRTNVRMHYVLIVLSIVVASVTACTSAAEKQDNESVSSISSFEYNCSVIRAVEVGSFDDLRQIADSGNIDEANLSFSNGIAGWGWGGNPPNCEDSGPNNSTSASNWRLHDWLRSQDHLAGPYKSGLKRLYIAEIDRNLVETIQSSDLPLGFDQRVAERISSWQDESSWTVVYFGYEG